MAQQYCAVKPNIVTTKHCKNTIDVQHLKRGTIFVGACALKLEGSWKKHDTYIELLDSLEFKVSGQCELKGGGTPYVGHFVVGLRKYHNMEKVQIVKSPPVEESKEDVRNHTPGLMGTIAMGMCDAKCVQFSLSNGEPWYKFWKMQKGLIIYGVTFTPV